jgi:hypothetical protein
MLLYCYNTFNSEFVVSAPFVVEFPDFQDNNVLNTFLLASVSGVEGGAFHKHSCRTRSLIKTKRD